MVNLIGKLVYTTGELVVSCFFFVFFNLFGLFVPLNKLPAHSRSINLCMSRYCGMDMLFFMSFKKRSANFIVICICICDQLDIHVVSC